MKVAIVVGVVLVISAIGTFAGQDYLKSTTTLATTTTSVNGFVGTPKPNAGIATMSCAELHSYYDSQITPNLAPGKPFAVQSQAGVDAEALNKRVDSLGCPGSDNW